MGKVLQYSYRDFSISDLVFKPAYTLKQIESFDKVELDRITDDQKVEIMTSGLEKSESDAEFVFKDLTITEICTDEYKKYKYYNQLRYWVYSQDNHGNMRIEAYTKDIMTSKFVNDYRFLVKSQHIYKLFNNLSKIPEDNNEYLVLTSYRYLIPVYVAYNRGYIRFSNYLGHKPDECSVIIQFLVSALARIISFNSLCCTVDDEVLEKETFSNVKLNVNYYAATSDKDQYVLITDKKTEPTTHKRETSSEEETKVIDRNICKRKFQVRGHWHKYWIGKRGNQHIEIKWVAPYYKNANENYSIIKHYRFISK